MSFLQNDGLSHSEIFGSKVICTYPKLIAAYHVLHRLREPRHPPCALAYFLSNVLFLYWYWYWNCFLLSILRTRTRTVWYILLALTKILLFVHHVKDRFSFQRWWRITDSNRWPSACKADALASWANPPKIKKNEQGRRKRIYADHCSFHFLSRSSPRQSWTADLYIISVAL